MSYRRGSTPNVDASQQALLDFLLRELEAVERSSVIDDFIRLKTFYSVPDKLLEGMIVLADGASWNPGSGAGVYAYYAGSWKKLG